MEHFELHPETPQNRYIIKAAQVLKKGGLLVYPTDSGYSIGCDAHNIKAIHKLYSVKRSLDKYVMALLLPNISQISEFAKMDNYAFKFIKSRVPGPYTFILPAQTHIARKLGVKRKEIGVRISNFHFLKLLFEEFDGPILNTSAKVSEDVDFVEPSQLLKAFNNQVDLVLSIGELQLNPTNIISLLDDEPVLIRGEL